MDSCAICCIDSKIKIKCHIETCPDYICDLCAVRYIEICAPENKLFSCVGENCKGMYDEVSLAGKIDTLVLTSFRKSIFNNMCMMNKDKVDLFEKGKAVFQIMKKEREQFLVENMPKALLKIASCLYKKKLHKINTHQADSFVKNNKVKLCFNKFCKGALDKQEDKYVCLKCSDNFCLKCEMKIDGTHTCDENILLNIKELEKASKCPKCGTAIFKSEGCDNMTCAVCNTKYLYYSGEVGGGGNHGKNTEIKVYTYKKISVDYKKDIPEEYMDGLQELEQEFFKKGRTQEDILTFITRNKYHYDIAQTDQVKNTILTQFSILYSDVIRKMARDNIISKKLFNIEKAIMSKNFADIPKYFDSFVNIYDIISKNKQMVIISENSIKTTLTDASLILSLNKMTIKTNGEGFTKDHYYKYG